MHTVVKLCLGKMCPRPVVLLESDIWDSTMYGIGSKTLEIQHRAVKLLLMKDKEHFCRSNETDSMRGGPWQKLSDLAFDKSHTFCCCNESIVNLQQNIESSIGYCQQTWMVLNGLEYLSFCTHYCLRCSLESNGISLKLSRIFHPINANFLILVGTPLCRYFQ